MSAAEKAPRTIEPLIVSGILGKWSHDIFGEPLKGDPWGINPNLRFDGDIDAEGNPWRGDPTTPSLDTSWLTWARNIVTSDPFRPLVLDQNPSSFEIDAVAASFLLRRHRRYKTPPEIATLVTPTGSGRGFEETQVYGWTDESLIRISMPHNHLEYYHVWVDYNDLADKITEYNAQVRERIWAGWRITTSMMDVDTYRVTVNFTPYESPTYFLRSHFIPASTPPRPHSSSDTVQIPPEFERSMAVRDRILQGVKKSCSATQTVYENTAWVMNLRTWGEPVDGIAPILPGYTSFSGSASESTIGITGAVVLVERSGEQIYEGPLGGGTLLDLAWRFCPAPDTSFGGIITRDLPEDTFLTPRRGLIVKRPLFDEPAETPELEAFRIFGQRDTVLLGTTSDVMKQFPVKGYYWADLWVTPEESARNATDWASENNMLNYPDPLYRITYHTGTGESALGPVPPGTLTRMPAGLGWLSPRSFLELQDAGLPVPEGTSPIPVDAYWHAVRPVYAGPMFNAHGIPVEFGYMFMLPFQDTINNTFLPTATVAAEILAAQEFVANSGCTVV